MCVPRYFILVHCLKLNSWFLLIHCSSSNILFRIGKRLFKGQGENIKFVRGPWIWFAFSDSSKFLTLGFHESSSPWPLSILGYFFFFKFLRKFAEILTTLCLFTGVNDLSSVLHRRWITSSVVDTAREIAIRTAQQMLILKFKNQERFLFNLAV